MTYREKLKDPRWISLSKLVKEKSNNTCAGCGTTRNLQAHHRKYVSGRHPWEYDLFEMVCLCRQCHKEYHGSMDVLLDLISNDWVSYKTLELHLIISTIKELYKLNAYQRLEILHHIKDKYKKKERVISIREEIKRTIGGGDGRLD